MRPRLFDYDKTWNIGKSGGRNCTFGFNERWDVKACTYSVYGQTGQDAVVVLHGESMGAPSYSRPLWSIRTCNSSCRTAPRRPCPKSWGIRLSYDQDNDYVPLI